jgi:SAM-dependent methyltransferase
MAKNSESFNPKQYWESRLEGHWGLHGVGCLGLGRYNEWVYRAKRTVFDRAIRRLRLPAAFSALDIGCGTGFYIDRWSSLGAGEITGLDLTSESVSRLQSRFPAFRFVQGDIGAPADVLNGTFDAISSMDVLFHIVENERYARALQNIYRLLNPKGYFVFSENFLHDKPAVGRHQVSRTLREIEEMLRRTGFSIIRRVPLHVLMNYPVDTRSALMKLSWDRFSDMIERHQWLGTLAGAAQYPLEMALVRVLRESPSTELMVCVRS